VGGVGVVLDHLDDKVQVNQMRPSPASLSRASTIGWIGLGAMGTSHLPLKTAGPNHQVIPWH
jgi:hypothetical protein